MGGGNTLSNFMAGFLGTLGGDIQEQRQKKLELQLQRIKDETSLLKDVLPNLPPNLQGMLFDKVMADYTQEGQLLDKGKKGKQPKSEGQGFGLHSLLSPLFGGGQKKQAQGQPQPQPQLPTVREPSMGQQIFGGQEAYQEQQFQKQLQRDKQIAATKDQEAYESTQLQLDNYAKAINDDPTIPAEQKPVLIARAREVAFYPGKIPEESKFSLDQLAAQTISDVHAGRKTKEQGQQILDEIATLKSEGGKPDQAARYEANYLAFHNLPPTPANKMKAFDEFTKKTKVEPGVIRMEALGDVRGPGPITDSITGQTRPMTWNEFKRMDKAYPGRFISPAYSPDVIAAVNTARSLAPKNIGTQVQSYGTLVRHTGDTFNRISTLVNTNYPMANRSINWLRTNSGDPRVRSFLVPLVAARTEYMTFLMNNRALYQEDRETADKLVDENASPLQMLDVLKGMVRVGTERLEEANYAYKRATGKDFPNLISPQVSSVYKQMGETPPSTIAGATKEEAGDENLRTIDLTK